MNISTWELSTIHPQVFMVWTSTLSSPDQARESPEERPTPEPSETSKRSARKKPSNGSSRSSEVPFSEQPKNSLSSFHFSNKLEITYILFSHLYSYYYIYLLIFVTHLLKQLNGLHMTACTLSR